MSDDREMREARAEADAARAELFAVVSELQRRAAPATIVKDGIEAVRDKATDVAADAGRFARKRPLIAAGAAAAAAGLIVWYPLRRLFKGKADR